MSSTSENDYKKILQIVQRKLKIPGITHLSQLNKLSTRIFNKKYKGTYPSDKIPNLTDTRPYCILNLDKSTESGSHWIAVIKIENKEQILVYDSFGRKHTEIIPSLKCKYRKYRILNTDDDIEQHILEENCGARCIAFLIFYELFGLESSIKI